MKINQLLYFVKTAQLQNVTQAASELYISPQALSKQIQLLEDELGCELFTRSHGRITLSPVGREIYVEAQRAVDVFESSVDKMKSIVNSDKGNLTLVCPEYSLLSFSEDPIAMFKKEFNARVDILEMREVLASDYILKNNLDFGISCTPFDANLYDSHLLYHTKLCAIVREGHPLRSKNSVSLKDVANYNVLARNKLYVTYLNLVNYCEGKGIKLNISSENSHYFHFRREITETDTVGIGISFLNVSNGLVKLTLEDDIYWSIYLITKKYTNIPFLEEKLIECFIKCSKAESAEFNSLE